MPSDFVTQMNLRHGRMRDAVDITEMTNPILIRRERLFLCYFSFQLLALTRSSQSDFDYSN